MSRSTLVFKRLWICGLIWKKVRSCFHAASCQFYYITTIEDLFEFSTAGPFGLFDPHSYKFHKRVTIRRLDLICSTSYIISIDSTGQVKYSYFNIFQNIYKCGARGPKGKAVENSKWSSNIVIWNNWLSARWKHSSIYFSMQTLYCIL